MNMTTSNVSVAEFGNAVTVTAGESLVLTFTPRDKYGNHRAVSVLPLHPLHLWFFLYLLLLHVLHRSLTAGWRLVTEAPR